MSTLLNITESNFEQEVMNYEGNVLVDFWAEWCGPCRLVGPVVEKISQDYSQNLKVVKLDVDANPKISEEFNIFSIPTILLFSKDKDAQGKRKVYQSVGFRPEPDMKTWLKEVGVAENTAA